MVDAVLTPARNVVDLATYRDGRRADARKALAIGPICRHCGAALSDGESDDDCSSAGLAAPLMPRRKFRAE